MTKQSHETSTDTTDLDRRALLRRGGAAVVAGVAGVAAVQTLTQTGAQAAVGEPVDQGEVNNAGAGLTTLTSTNAEATLRLSNTGTAGAPLNLVASSTLDVEELTNGDLANIEGDLVYATTIDVGTGTVDVPGAVYTDYNASQTVPIVPQRALDTRSASGRQRIVPGTLGNIERTTGRLLGGRSIELDLSDYVTFGLAAFLNVTVVGATQPGYLTVYPGGPRPATSTLNYQANQVLSNSAVVGLNVNDGLVIYSQRTVHVVVDVTAFTVGSFFQVDSDALGPLKAARAAKAAKAAKARAAKAGK